MGAGATGQTKWHFSKEARFWGWHGEESYVVTPSPFHMSLTGPTVLPDCLDYANAVTQEWNVVKAVPSRRHGQVPVWWFGFF
jgi:hypothetical protein